MGPVLGYQLCVVVSDVGVVYLNNLKNKKANLIVCYLSILEWEEIYYAQDWCVVHHCGFRTILKILKLPTDYSYLQESILFVTFIY